MRTATQYALLRLAAGMALLGTFTAPAAAQRVYREGNAWVEETTGTLPSAKHLKVSAPVGAVKVEGSARSDFAYVIKKRAYTSSEHEARRMFQTYRISASKAGEAAVFEGSWGADSPRRRASADFFIEAPRELAVVKVLTQGGSVSVKNIAGEAYLKTAGGSISLDEIGGPVIAETAGGSIDLGTCSNKVSLRTMGGSISVQQVAGRIDAETLGGSVWVGSGGQAVVLKTAGGSITVGKTGAELIAETLGGSIEVGEVWGAATLATSGGSIRLSGARGAVVARTAGGGLKLQGLTEGVRAETNAGPIWAEFVRGAKLTDSELETSHGDVVIWLPANAAVTIDAAIDVAQSHKIRSDFSEVKVRSEGPEWGPRHVYAEGAINGGGPVLRIRTTLGNIELRKLK
jgi:DUF4097 and DUF4098 domain-containing protein YvlB